MEIEKVVSVIKLNINKGFLFVLWRVKLEPEILLTVCELLIPSER